MTRGPWRGSAFLVGTVFCVALFFVGAAFLWPAWKLFLACCDARGTTTNPISSESIEAFVFVRSLGFAMTGALGGVLLAWCARRVTRRVNARSALALSDRLVACVIVLPIVVPPWLLYAALWMSCGPGTLIGDWCERADLVSWLRVVLLVYSLVVWSMAASFAVFLSADQGRSRSDDRLLRLDGAGLMARARALLARDGRIVSIAFLACTAFLFCETTVFDLAQVRTFGFELRTLDALGAAPEVVVRAAWPALALLAFLVVGFPALLRLTGDAQLRWRGGSDALVVRRPWMRVAAITPMALFLVALLRVMVVVPNLGDFPTLYGGALLSSLAIAACAALIGGVVALCLRLLLDASRGVLLCAAWILVGACALSGLIPATISALSIEAAYNTISLGAIYDSAAAPILVLVARALPIAALVTSALAMREAPTARRLRALDSSSAVSVIVGLRRELAVAFGASAAFGFAWSLGELTASGRVIPPGLPWLATDLLNALHYQRPETVMLAVVVLVLAALPALWLVLPLTVRLRSGSSMTMLLSAALLLISCGSSERPESAAGDSLEERTMEALRHATPSVRVPLEVSSEFVGVGRGAGQFNSPRVVAFDTRDGSTYVIDKDARVQRILDSGKVAAQWRLPKTDRGKPVGASVAPDGSLVVADTHEHRMLCFTPDGELLWELGAYGTEPGQFIYPTDIAFTPDGRMLITEYGGNDRVQVFGADRRFLYQFGRCGSGSGEFLRPQSLAYDAARDELYIADAGNHRIAVFTSDGEFRRSIGKAGLAAGEFSYPFGVALQVGGRAVNTVGESTLEERGETEGAELMRTIVVVEHSNHRLQLLDAESGESLAIAGGLGTERGRLKYPWAVASAGVSADGSQRFAVCDNGNSRIQFFALPALEKVHGSPHAASHAPSTVKDETALSKPVR